MDAIKLNPQFDDLHKPETFTSHFQQLQNELDNQKNTFPVEVFPLEMQRIISATHKSLNFPIDFTGAAMLYAVSVAIGNTYKAEVKKGWHESAVLYLSIVGRAGTNKSHPLSFAVAPIEKRDKLQFDTYQKKFAEYEAASKLTKTEREEQGIDEPAKPNWQQLLVADFTPEALTEVHKNNVRGIGVYADELASWFKNFNRYNKGSEEQFWLSVWSGKPIRINRKTSQPVYIPLPFISVIGTIQPTVLNELAENRTENGFLDRLLFVAPEYLQKEYWSEKELKSEISESWENIIYNLLNVECNTSENSPAPEILPFAPDAKALLYKWQKQQTDLSNQPDNEALSGIFAKMEMYAVRLALCLELTRYACGHGQKDAISIEATKGALKLVEYFKRTAFRVNAIVTENNPLDKLTTDKQNLYSELPETFATNEGVRIAESVNISERTFKRLLAKKELFKKVGRGNYEKLL